MARWKGNVRNPAPNPIQAPIERAEKMESVNRVEQVRRDTDKQKNITISLYDIDETILLHLEQLQLQIEDQGKQVKVPFFYGSPERWVSARRDGYIRDKQGKIILPAVILKRTNSETDSALQFFHRYLNVPVIKRYSEKNAYTQFSALIKQNTPINDVYNITMPNHMVLTYHFIIWTAYVEQMNKLIETFQFNTKDYWGNKKGFRFRTRIESYGHTVEIQANEERIVKTEFDLITHGYILPDSMTKLEDHILTTQKFLTPKKVVMGMETVTTDFDFNTSDPNREKWQSPYYPNLQRDVKIPPVNVSINTNIIDTRQQSGIAVEEMPLFLRIAHVPTHKNAAGQEGSISYDLQYFYVYYKNEWRRAPLVDFTPDCSDDIPATGTPGQVVTTNPQFFYIYSGKKWKRTPVEQVDLSKKGADGDIMFDTEYFYIYNNNSWRRFPLLKF